MLEFSQNLALSWPLVKNNYTVLLPGGCNLRSKTNSSPKILILNFCISARPEGPADHCAVVEQSRNQKSSVHFSLGPISLVVNE